MLVKRKVYQLLSNRTRCSHLHFWSQRRYSCPRGAVLQQLVRCAPVKTTCARQQCIAAYALAFTDPCILLGGSAVLLLRLQPNGHVHAQAPQGALGRLRQQLASLWGSPSTPQQQQGSPSLATSALTSLKATAARWLAKKAEDSESREALLAFGSSSLLDFLVSTATEETTTPEQQHAEQAVVSVGSCLQQLPCCGAAGCL